MQMKSGALLSENRIFRYWLLRAWEDLPLLAVIGCNPSTADETADDPTIRKCIGFAKRMEYGGILMLNVGAYRATDPKDWKAARDPFGPENTIEHLRMYIDQFSVHRVIAAWGKPCVASQRGQHRAAEITRQIPNLYCWGRNADGSPRHPLMLSYETKLELLCK